MLFSTLGAILLGSMLSGKGVKQHGKGTIRLGQNF